MTNIDRGTQGFGPSFDKEAPAAPTPHSTMFYRQQKSLGKVSQVVTLPRSFVAALDRYASMHGLPGRGAALIHIWERCPQVFAVPELPDLIKESA